MYHYNIVPVLCQKKKGSSLKFLLLFLNQYRFFFHPIPIYLNPAIFYITTTLGPAVGFLLGSEFLNIYTDILINEE